MYYNIYLASILYAYLVCVCVWVCVIYKKISTGSFMTHASLLWSPASSSSTISSHGRVGLLCSARGQHAPGISFLEPTREGHSLSSRSLLVEISGFRRSSAAGESPKKARVTLLYTHQLWWRLFPDAGFVWLFCLCSFVCISIHSLTL